MKKIVLFIYVLLTVHIISGQPFSLDKTFNIRCTAETIDGHIFNGVFEDDDGTFLIYGDFNLTSCSGFAYSWGNDIRVDEEGYSMERFENSVSIVKDIQKKGNIYYRKTRYEFSKLDYLGKNIDIPFTNNPAEDFGYGLLSPITDGVFLDDGGVIFGANDLIPYGASADSQSYIFKTLPTGKRDWNFFHKVDKKVTNVKKYGDFVYISGGFTKYDGCAQNQYGRIDLDGNLDENHRSPFTSNSYHIIPIYQHDDGKVMIIGRFNIEGADNVGVVRLMPDGSIDPSFHIVSIASSDQVLTLCPTKEDGGYLIGGNFSDYDGYKRTCIVKLDKNGYADPEYFNGTVFGPSSYVYLGVRNIIPGKNDTYYVTGCFNSYFGEKVKPAIRIKGLTHVSINEIGPYSQLSIFPNPANGEEVTISFPEQISGETEITITNMLGKNVKTIVLGQNGGNISVAGFPAGVYLLSAKNGKNIFKKEKLIVCK